MKKITLLLIAFALALSLAAQHDGKPHKKAPKPEISELVGDLNAVQKRKVETISRESKERVAALRKQKHSVCDSIAMFMELEGNHSRELYPLFDREAKLQVAINREMYDTKLRIDEVLNAKQRQALREACRKDKPQDHKR